VTWEPWATLEARTAAVVHHCGSGTTATALGAGVPSVGVPFFADQPFWSARLAAIGAAPAPIPFRRLSAESLTRAIRVATDSSMKKRAAGLGEKVRAEDGVARAVDVIGRLPRG
jgi:UDP:flavonoid glycosyltransferase YjiC (YdhE family)